MTSYELQQFATSIVTSRQLLSHIAAWPEYGVSSKVPEAIRTVVSRDVGHLDSVLATISKFVETVPKIDHSLMQRSVSKIKQSDLHAKLTAISARLSVLLAEPKLSLWARLTSAAQPFKFGDLVDLLSVIGDLGTLRDYVNEAIKLQIESTHASEELFIPSGFQTSELFRLLDLAEASVRSCPNIDVELSAKIEIYLLDCREEAKKANPSWKKIVGALAIICAVISGLADAPNALRCVRDAFEYVVAHTKAEQTSQPNHPSLPNSVITPHILPPPRDSELPEEDS